uniref:Putative secreted protein n=2 Tax=Ixodes ricinus TaxID=34613 RepID=A0A090X9I4_IXORI
MIAALFLVIQLLGQSESQTILCDGDFPNATEVMVKLPRTYRLQSAFNVSNLDCVYQVFYNITHRNKTYKKYNLVYMYTVKKYKDFQDQPFYVRGVENYTIILAYKPDEYFQPEKKELILYSDKETCMVTKDPNSHFTSNVCSLLVTEASFYDPRKECTQAFIRHCGHAAYNFTSISRCVNRTDYN